MPGPLRGAMQSEAGSQENKENRSQPQDNRRWASASSSYKAPSSAGHGQNRPMQSTVQGSQE